VDGRAQIVISRYTDPEPFRRAFWQTDWLPVATLAPGDASALSWRTPVDLPGGSYGLSVWLHARMGSTLEHSQATFNIPLKLGPNASHVQRAQPARAPLQVREATLDAGRLAALVDSSSEQPQSVTVRAERVSERRRFDWYLTPLGPESVRAALVLAGRSSQQIELPLTVDCTGDGRLVHLTLVPASASATDPAFDDLLIDACA